MQKRLFGEWNIGFRWFGLKKSRKVFIATFLPSIWPVYGIPNQISSHNNHVDLVVISFAVIVACAPFNSSHCVGILLPKIN